MRGHVLFLIAFVGSATICTSGSAMAAQCLLCTPAPEASAGERAPAPLSVEIGSGLDFDRVAATGSGGGSVSIDPVSRSRRIDGALSDLGGLVMTGTAMVRGEAGRVVRITLPAEVLLRSAGGPGARISRLVTDLPASPRLGADGVLRFSFGGRLDVTGDGDGDYRGRIAITVDYE